MNNYEQLPVNIIIKSQHVIDRNNSAINEARNQLRSVDELVLSGGVHQGEITDFFREKLCNLIGDNELSRRTASAEVPYEKIGKLSLGLETEITGIEDQIKGQENSLLDDVEKLAAVASLVSSEGIDFALDVIEKKGGDNKLKQLLDEKKSQLDLVNNVFENTGKAWPLIGSHRVSQEPTEDPDSAMRPKNKQARHEDYEKNATKGKASRRARLETGVVVRGVGEEIADFLADNQGQVFTYEQLGHEIYLDSDVRSENRPVRGRTLSPRERKGKRARIRIADALIDKSSPMATALRQKDLVLVKIPLAKEDSGENARVGITVVPKHLANSYGIGITEPNTTD